ncbi:16S rRNA (cytosine(967)-C(5))-methyltransferase, partial [Brevibacillus sp. SIMBA_076]
HIEAKALDARKTADYYSEASFDRILIDAPCSGFGVIRRKPDMKYTKSQEDSARLAIIQQAILNETASLLKPGGTLVYSTCTMDPTENQQV